LANTDATNIKGRVRNRRFGLQRARQAWPVWLSALLAATLIWTSMRWTVFFYVWHRGFTVFLGLLALVIGIGFLKVWPKPEPFSMRAQSALKRSARRFWLANLLIHLVLALFANALVWGLLWLFGPRVGVLGLAGLVEALSFAGLIGAWVWRLPPTVALCWDQSPHKRQPKREDRHRRRRAKIRADFLSKLQWWVWFREFSLAQRHRNTLKRDLVRSQPKSLAMVRALEQGDSGNLTGAGQEWQAAEWRSAWLSRAQAAMWIGLATVPVILLVIVILLGGLSFTTFPPGYLQGDRSPMALLAQKERATPESPEPQADENADPASKDSEGEPESQADETKGDSESESDGDSDKVDGAGESSGSTKGEGGQDGGSGEGDTGEPADSSSGSEGLPNSQNRNQGPEQKNQPNSSNSPNQQENSRRDSKGLEMPGGMPGQRPGADGTQPTSQNGMQPMGKPGQSGEGEGMESGQQSEGGDGSGKGQTSPSGGDGAKPSDDSLKGQGSREGPQTLEYGSGGGPRSGLPGPPSPPDPGVQELVKIEVPPVESGDLSRRALDKDPQRGRGTARSMAEREANARNRDPVKVQREPDQPLPNWILLMLKNPPKQKRSESP